MSTRNCIDSLPDCSGQSCQSVSSACRGSGSCTAYFWGVDFMVYRSIANWLTFCSGGESNAGRESEQYEKQRRHIHARHAWHTCFRGRSGLRILRCKGREPICWNFSRRSILGTGSPYMVCRTRYTFLRSYERPRTTARGRQSVRHFLRHEPRGRRAGPP